MNRLKTSFKTLLFSGVFSLFFLSCQMQQEITIKDNGTGVSTFSISLADYVIDVIDQVTAMASSDQSSESVDLDNTIFNTTALETEFKKNQYLSQVSFANPAKNKLIGSFSFTDLNRILSKQEFVNKENPLIHYKKDKNTSSISIKINRETIINLLNENPAFNNPVIDNFGPLSTEGLSEAEYLDMMEFALGEESRQGIIQSSFSITVEVPHKIISQNGGSLLNENTIQFTIPLIDILLLNKNLIYSISFN